MLFFCENALFMVPEQGTHFKIMEVFFNGEQSELCPTTEKSFNWVEGSSGYFLVIVFSFLKGKVFVKGKSSSGLL